MKQGDKVESVMGSVNNVLAQFSIHRIIGYDIVAELREEAKSLRHEHHLNPNK